MCVPRIAFICLGHATQTCLANLSLTYPCIYIQAPPRPLTLGIGSQVLAYCCSRSLLLLSVVGEAHCCSDVLLSLALDTMLCFAIR